MLPLQDVCASSTTKYTSKLGVLFNKFSAENVLTWEIKLKQNVLSSFFFFFAYLRKLLLRN